MGFWYDMYQICKIREHEYKFAGNCGKKGEVRGKREKPTAEEMELINRLNKAKKIRRTIALNYDIKDYWITLTYEKGKRKPIEKVKQDVKDMVDKLRYRYKRRGEALKWMLLVEIGKLGGIHAHIIINRIEGTDLMVAELWEHGHPYFVPLYQEGNFEQLGSYMAKVPDEEDEKNPDKKRVERMEKITKENYYYSTSRNLIRPEPTVHKRYFRRTMERIIREGPKPSEGYYIDWDSVKKGVNKVTGFSYLYYTEILIENDNKRKRRI